MFVFIQHPEPKLINIQHCITIEIETINGKEEPFYALVAVLHNPEQDTDEPPQKIRIASYKTELNAIAAIADLYNALDGRKKAWKPQPEPLF